MIDASNSPTRPNPLRTVLVFLAAVAIFVGYSAWVGGTGGLDTSVLETEEPEVGVSFTLGGLLRPMSVPTVLLLAVSLITATLRAGWRHTKAGLRFALGSGDPCWMPGAARFWATAARVAAWGGVILGVAATAATETIVYRAVQLGYGSRFDDAYYDAIWNLQRWALSAPLVGILFGRFVFGLLAGGARIRADEPRSEPVFSRVQDVALAALVVLPWYQLLLMTWRFSP